MEDSVARDLLVSLLEKGIGIHNADLSWEKRDIMESRVLAGCARAISGSSAPPPRSPWA